MNQIYGRINLLLLAATAVSCVCYDIFGGLWLKALTAFWFALLGLVNLGLCLREKKTGRGFAPALTLGLWVCMTADVTLGFNFILGAAIFATGHVLYTLAYCRLEKPAAGDLRPVGAVFLVTAVLLALPIFDFGGAVMTAVCWAYGAIISCMVGKAWANYRRSPNRVTGLLLLGSGMFYFSDLMLVLCWFAGAPRITDTLCLFTYFPGQAVLAHTLYHYAKQ